MVNTNKIRGRIVELGLSVEAVADAMEINRSTLYRKLNSGGEAISIREASQLSTILQLSPNEAANIFFAE